MHHPADTERNPALDAARTTAVLLGVFYQAIWCADLANGTIGLGNGGASGRVEDALRLVLAPLLFVISGWVSAGMLARRGPGRYLTRRWLRLGVPIVLAMVIVVPIYHRSIEPSHPAPGPGRGHSPFPRIGLPGHGRGHSRPIEPGFHLKPTAGPAAELHNPIHGQALITPPFPPPSDGHHPGPGERPDRPALRLEFVWFLWYLLVFATITPCLAWAGRQFLVKPWPRFAGRLERGLIGKNLVPAALGLIALPALLLAPSSEGWFLSAPMGASAAFPKVLVTPMADMPYYLAFFLAGWWLFRNRIGLDEIGRHCNTNLLIGLLAHGAASLLSEEYAWRRNVPYHDLIRYAGLGLYTIGAAHGTIGLLGCFVTSSTRPNRLIRYLADRSYWIYLVHLPMIAPLYRVLKPLELPWWAQGLLISAIATAVAIVLHDLLVTWTPLARLSGSRAEPDQAALHPGLRAADT